MSCQIGINKFKYKFYPGINSKNIFINSAKKQRTSSYGWCDMEIDSLPTETSMAGHNSPD